MTGSNEGHNGPDGLHAYPGLRLASHYRNVTRDPIEFHKSGPICRFNSRLTVVSCNR